MSDIGALVSAGSSFTDRTGEKKRPGLIIGEYLNDYLVAFISKQVEKYQNEPTALIITNDDLASGGLKHRSIIRCHKTYWVQKSLCTKICALKPEVTDKVLRLAQAFSVGNYCRFAHGPKPFVPGKSRIPYAGRVFDEKDVFTLVDASLDFWLTAGRYAEKFETEFKRYVGVKHCSLTNSGSSANLLAFMALTSPKLGARRIRKHDEVITVAAGFPTTVAAIIQYGAVPVFLDIELPTYNIDCRQLEAALSEKTKAVMLAHTLGNPFDIGQVLAFCRKHDLWFIEDCCDALGSTYLVDSSLSYDPGSTSPETSANSHSSFVPCSSFLDFSPLSSRLTPRTSRLVGTFGHLATFSFYPAHHMTMGEGGAVCTNDITLKRLVESFRDWGRDCWCAPGKDNTCGRRFNQQFGELPKSYDHKYVYSHFGYNLKVTDMQAAIGCAQLEKLPRFIEARKDNWRLMYDGLAKMRDRFILPEPTPHSDPSWFGFLITVKEDSGFTRDQIVAHLEKAGIQTRMLFAGNLIKHPCFDEMRRTARDYRVVSSPLTLQLSNSELRTLNSLLPNTDRIMNDTFFLGTYPGSSKEQIDYIINIIDQFIKNQSLPRTK